MDKGFRKGVDYFSSMLLMMNCLKTNAKYCNQPAIKSIVEEYEKYDSIPLESLIDREIVDHLKKEAPLSMTSVKKRKLNPTLQKPSSPKKETVVDQRNYREDVCTEDFADTDIII